MHDADIAALLIIFVFFIFLFQCTISFLWPSNSRKIGFERIPAHKLPPADSEDEAAHYDVSSTRR